MKYSPITELKVGLNFDTKTIPVGRLALRAGQIYFEYDRTFLATGLEISPLNLPPAPGVKKFDPMLFEGLAGVFYDCLPDGWGRLLQDRYMRQMDILPQQLTALDRLAFLGKNTMGALVFEPDNGINTQKSEIDLDLYALHAAEVLEGLATDFLQELLAANGSSAGARPKALIGVNASRTKITNNLAQLPENYEYWLVKFPNNNDGADAGAIEYVYSLMATDAGIIMTQTHLFPAKNGAGYFATKRFDHNQNNRLHTHTAGGLLHSNFRTPSLDYTDLIALTTLLTHDIREAEKMFRLAVFNVLSHNRDDHAKNFTFLMDQTGQWQFAPAYDLTFSSGPCGQQSTMVMGEGKNPGIKQLTELGLAAKIPKKTINEIIEQTRQATHKWPELSAQYGVSKANIDLIGKRIFTIH